MSKQVVIEQINSEIIVIVDGKVSEFLIDDDLTPEEVQKIKKKKFELEHRNITRSIFKI